MLDKKIMEKLKTQELALGLSRQILDHLSP